MRASLLCLVFCIAATYAFVFEPMERNPIGWNRAGEPKPTTPLRLQLALKQQNMDIVEKTLLRISDPREETYGQWLNLDQLAELIAPSDAEIARVEKWLNSYGISDVETRVTKDWLIAETTVEHVEQLLNCNIIYFHHKFRGDFIMRAEAGYEIPDELAEIIDFVVGLQGFPYSDWKPTTYEITSTRLGGNTPDTINSLYDITAPTTSCNCDASQAVVEFSSANYSPSDLQVFFQKYAPQLEGQTIENIYGNNNADGFTSVEANLDVQYIMAIGGFIPTDDYVEPINPNILDAFLNYCWTVGNQTNPPLVHSISWGEYGGSYNNQTVQRINNEFMLMGTRGITVSLASGDNGVGCGDKCQSQEFDFPSSPYVTMVGATGLNAQGKEVGASFSSGGFSGDYYRPTWQSDAVSSYLTSNSNNLPTINFDSNGRAYPDVSALGVSLEVVVRGRAQLVDGTSCSAPIFGGVISLLNAQRSLQGKSPLGFINPWIYQNPSMFTDITSGSNSYLCCEGFEAASGWDPVTGMGTPIYSEMLTRALALP